MGIILIFMQLLFNTVSLENGSHIKTQASYKQGFVSWQAGSLPSCPKPQVMLLDSQSMWNGSD